MTNIAMVDLGGAHDLPLLVLGPSLGTTADALWSASAAGLTGTFHVVGWDLPGHGTTESDGEPVTMASLAAGVLAGIDRVQRDRRQPGAPFTYAGDSVGGCVGLQLLLDAPDRVSTAVLLCTGAKIGEPAGWLERAAAVRASGISGMVEPSAGRWFSPGYLDREPERGQALLGALAATDGEGYARVCEALAAFDVRHRLGEIRHPVLAVAGEHDQVTTPAVLQQVATGVRDGRLVVLDGVAHQAPLESPMPVARLIREHVAASRTVRQVREAGLAVRTEVLGAEHVERAGASTTDLTREFQDLITQYAWGTIWTRPGLDRRSRSMITLTALVARGHHEELALHLRAARTNGLTTDEIKELLLQTAIYCGVPDANTAFRIAQQILDEPGD